MALTGFELVEPVNRERSATLPGLRSPTPIRSRGEEVAALGHCLTWHAELQVLAASSRFQDHPRWSRAPWLNANLITVDGMGVALDAAKKATAGKLLIQGNKRPKHSAFLLPSAAG